MKRWSQKREENHENLKIDKFLLEIIEVCKKHDMSISHEDGHGAFIIEKASDDNFDWLMNAHDYLGI